MTGQIEPIRGKVARILNDREVALNLGSSHGVKIGMKFNILSTSGHDIRDPDTGESLGSIERTKARVQVTTVQDRLSVARTYQKYKVNVGGKGLSLRMFEPPKWELRYVTLHSEDAREEDIDESDSYVSTGDPIVQVVEVIPTDDHEQVPEGAPQPSSP